MKLRQMTATFGKLSGDTLVLSPGLNLIHAPNESGKTTWCAFLRNMLYGLPTRDRKPTADKNRYAPWSGSPMQGVLELESSLGEITPAAPPGPTPPWAPSPPSTPAPPPLWTV